MVVTKIYLTSEGIKEGNIITAINNTEVNSIDDVKTIIENRDPYKPLSIEIINSKGEKTRYGLSKLNSILSCFKSTST